MLVFAYVQTKRTAENAEKLKSKEHANSNNCVRHQILRVMEIKEENSPLVSTVKNEKSSRTYEYSMLSIESVSSDIISN